MFCYCMMNLLMKQEVCQFNRNLARDFFLNHLLVLVKYLLSLSQELYFCHRNTVPVRKKNESVIFFFNIYCHFVLMWKYISYCDRFFLLWPWTSSCDIHILPLASTFIIWHWWFSVSNINRLPMEENNLFFLLLVTGISMWF